MVIEAEKTDTEESRTSEFPEVPDEAIVKPEDEKAAKMSKRPEEELPGDENKHDNEGIGYSTDMDGEGSRIRVPSKCHVLQLVNTFHLTEKVDCLVDRNSSACSIVFLSFSDSLLPSISLNCKALITAAPP
jgi:hypothetical protein